MPTTYNNHLPMICCPHCGTTFQWDDYYDVKSGDSIECLKCEKEIFVLLVDRITTAILGTEAQTK